MALDFNTLTQKTLSLFKNEKSLKAVFMILGFAAIILLLAAILMKNVTKEDYAVLYTHLSPDDAGSILSVLQEERIKYKIEGNGSIILVPQKNLYDIRLKLAAKGLPSSKVVGFEIFDEPKMGATHFQENINYLRAIEGELARTVKQLDAVQNAKVNIALPKSSIFARDEENAKASVILKLWPGRDLNKEQVKAVVFLVSHAVEKLNPQNVTVVDNRGRVLTDMLEPSEEERPSDAVEMKKKIEREIEKSVQSMLSKALGPQKVVVRASVDIESSKVSQQDELYDPDKVAVVSERKIQEKEKGYRKKPEGMPGTATNVPAVIDRQQKEDVVKEKSRKDVTTNYDVSKSIIKTQKNLFSIKKLSVGVLVDGRYKTVKDGNNTETKEFVPRSKEELAIYEELVKSAIGFDPKRGDKVTVVSVPFEAPEAIEERRMAEGLTAKEMALLAAIGVLALVIIALIGFLTVKGLKAKKEAKMAEEAAFAESMEEMKTMHEKEIELLDLEREPAYQKILQMTDENPQMIADMISKWMKEETK
ncbi:flagellar basal-body MS-ring/collar protein FliF [Nitrosophilus alvini]|uniref:flagellar basal-body MS-ring/collar protein FliF n=1 Tax=Nitrosophilus alvini TaxID=2714855 RepID=UPI00190BBA3F|nr:flagellar basal-body MS-ring/collar protein FliF [Nitrosophilus alvini]